MMKVFKGGKVAFWKDGEMVFTEAAVGFDRKFCWVSEASMAPSIVDYKHLWILPGVIDPQVHFREPGAEHKETIETGARAAVAGGTTSFLEMPNTNPPTIDQKTVNFKKWRASETSLANYGFFLGATPKGLSELQTVEGVCGIKVFMGSSTGTLMVDKPKDQNGVFRAAPAGRVIAVHAEDEERLKHREAFFREATGGEAHPLIHPEWRDAYCAEKATIQALALAKRCEKRLHVLHVTTREEIELIRAARESGVKVTCEVCPQHLYFQAPSFYEKLGTYARMNPPIREQYHSAALWKAVMDGSVDCIATDHAPHTREEKEQEYWNAPSGMPGVETSLTMMLHMVRKRTGDGDPNNRYSGLIRLFKMMSDGPRRIYGISQRGRIEKGFYADFVLFDPLKEWVIGKDRPIYSKCGWSPFDGEKVMGQVVATYVNGQCVFREGEFIENAPKGMPLF